MTKGTITASILALLLTLLLTACNDDRVFDKYIHADENGWEKNDDVSFCIDSLKEGGMYSMTLGIRMNKEYPFQNIQIVVDQTVYPEQRTLSDKVTCKVTDSNGLMLGHGISLYQYDIPIRKTNYEKGDSITVRIRHNMKREILPGIVDIGMVLRKSN